ncbi:MAG: hypothetical protein HY052_02880 [Proteobacteria bacterium]|nr:hypothetical protein [Pseudomonadota bacterium]
MKMDDGNKSKHRTILDLKDRFSKRFVSIATVFTLLVGGAGIVTAPGCDSRGWSDDDQEQVDLPEDIANMDQDHKDATLVNGRQAAIDTLIARGKTPQQAKEICDSLTTAAMKTAQYQQAIAAQNNQNQNQGSGMNNFLFWYLIMNNNSSPRVYYGSQGSGLTYLHGAGSGASVMSHINPIQGEFLHTAPIGRVNLVSSMATRPGIHIVSIPHASTGGHSFISTSHGGLGGHGIGMGG